MPLNIGQAKTLKHNKGLLDPQLVLAYLFQCFPYGLPKI